MNSKFKRVYKPKLLDVKNLHQVSEGCWKVFQSSSLKKKTQINVGARLAWRKTFVSFVH